MWLYYVRFIKNATAKNALAGLKDYDDICVALADGTTRRCILSHYFMPFYNGHRQNAIHLHGHSHNTEEHYLELGIIQAIMDNFPEIYNYYDMQMSMEKVVAGNELMDFDICRMIVGCNSSNIIFLSDDERVALEKSSDYKRKLALNVEKNIKLRRYGSAYFRRQSIMQGDMYLAHNVPYNIFVMSLRMNEILHFNKKENPYLLLYYSLSNKALATLSLLEDNFLDNCYPICRAIIELYLKLLLFKDYPGVSEREEQSHDIPKMGNSEVSIPLPGILVQRILR